MGLYSVFPQLSLEREEQERRELQKMMMDESSKDKGKGPYTPSKDNPDGSMVVSSSGNFSAQFIFQKF